MTAEVFGKDKLRKGDRVEVIDLRTGVKHEGVVEADPDQEDRVVVLYDGGVLVRVGVGFVRKVEA
jgi:hypothetical protein